jgi:hypothetical protein
MSRVLEEKPKLDELRKSEVEQKPVEEWKAAVAMRTGLAMLVDSVSVVVGVR